MYDLIMEFLIENGIMCNLHFGYREQDSTLVDLIILCDNIFTAYTMAIMYLKSFCIN